MNWQDELKKEIEDKTLLDFDSLDWKVLISFIELQLKKQREICAATAEREEPELMHETFMKIKNAPEPGGSE